MDYFRIIASKGYRFEDLNERNQDIINWLNHLREDIENFEWEDEDVCLSPDTIIGKMKAEIAENVIEQVKFWMDVQIAEYQICLAEGQDDEE